MVQNVISVSMIDSVDLEDVIRSSADNKVTVPNNLQTIPVKIHVPAKLTINNKVEDKNTLWQTTLVFRTCQDVFSRRHMCYIVALADGTRYLIGSKDRPYPVTAISETKPENLSDSQLNEVTVTLTSTAKPPQIA